MDERTTVFPPEIDKVSPDMETGDLISQLEKCIAIFKIMSQDVDKTRIRPLAKYLLSKSFTEHPSLEVRVSVAVIIAEILRVFAPDQPYEIQQVKDIFEFFLLHFEGLKDNSGPLYHKCEHFFKMLTTTNAFLIGASDREFYDLYCRVYKWCFEIVSENSDESIYETALDTLTNLISPNEFGTESYYYCLIQILFNHITEPKKSQNVRGYSLAQDTLVKTVDLLKPYIEGTISEGIDIIKKTPCTNSAYEFCEIIYEVNKICPSSLITIFQSLELEMKNDKEEERKEVVTVLGRIFSPVESTIIKTNKTLWSSFLSSFNDCSPEVQICAIQSSAYVFRYHPEVRNDITDKMKLLHENVDKNIRYEAICFIKKVTEDDVSCITQELLFITEKRCDDKEFFIREIALVCLGMVYKKLMKLDASPSEKESFSWIKNKVLHAYNRTPDRFVVERIFRNDLIPYAIPAERKVKLLYQLFCSVDHTAIKSLQEILESYSVLKSQVKSILEVLNAEFDNELIDADNSANEETLALKIKILSKHFENQDKSCDYLSRFFRFLKSNGMANISMSSALQNNVSSSRAKVFFNDILRAMERPWNKVSIDFIKELFERMTPTLFDSKGIQHLVEYVKNSLLDDHSIEVELGIQNSSLKGLVLLMILSDVNPAAFHNEAVYRNLLLFLQVNDEKVTYVTLEILKKVSNKLESNFPEIFTTLLRILENLITRGTAKLAKHAVYFLSFYVFDRETVFRNILHNLKEHLTHDSQYFRTALVSIGHIAYFCSDVLKSELQNIIASIMKDLFLFDPKQDLPQVVDSWEPYENLSEVIKVQIEGMKLLIRFLISIKNVNLAIAVLKTFTCLLSVDGAVLEMGKPKPIESAWLRVSAAVCMLKLYKQPKYAEVIHPKQFQNIVFTINDKCTGIRDIFLQKVHKYLLSGHLPLKFFAVFSLAALDEREDFKEKARTCLLNNIKRRKQWLKHRNVTGEELRQLLPSYSLPYAVHLLAHLPILRSYNDVASLKKIKECLWFLMNPLMRSYSKYSACLFKHFLEAIKRMKDKIEPNTEEATMKLYAVCDLAISIVVTKTTRFARKKDFPVEPVLPKELYSELNPYFWNSQIFLPPELLPNVSLLKCGVEIKIFEGPNKQSCAFWWKEPEIRELRTGVSQSASSVPAISLKSNKTHSNDAENVLESSGSSNIVQESSSNINANEIRMPSHMDGKGLKLLKNLRVVLTPLKPSRLPSKTNRKSTKCNGSSPLEKQNAVTTSEMKQHSSCCNDILNSMKDCKVLLKRDEVEKYIALNNSINNPLYENCTSNMTDIPTPLKKRWTGEVLQKDSKDEESYKSGAHLPIKRKAKNQGKQTVKKRA